jgi:hypothetical protein
MQNAISNNYNRMNFFKITAVVEARFAYASGYGPLEHMPFIDDLDEDLRKSRYRFWEVNPSPPGLQIDPGGREWPDCIRVSLGNPMACYSDRVINDLREAGISIHRITEMPIAEIAAKRMQKITPPVYYVLEGSKGIDVDFLASGYPVDAEGSLTGESPKGGLAQLKLSLKSWSGDDLLCYRNKPAVIHLICTERVKKLCEMKGWTGFKFRELPVVP